MEWRDLASRDQGRGSAVFFGGGAPQIGARRAVGQFDVSRVWRREDDANKDLVDEAEGRCVAASQR
jgi:hypothetical protein